ncbi:MAG: GntR family transcriptional regulator [Opitutales bacterium]
MSESISQRHVAYEFIRSRISEGKLSPGERVSDFVLAKEIGVSRTPVREAITQLASEGLIEHIPQFGSFVKKLSRQELAELFDLREMLESYATKAAAERISPVVVKKLKLLCDEMLLLIDQLKSSGADDLYGEILRQQVKDDLTFHLLILRNSRCSHVLRVVSDLRILTNLFLLKRREPSLDAVAHLKNVHREHCGVVEALQNGDGELAADIMGRHLRRAKEVALDYFDAHVDETLLSDSEERGMPIEEVSRKIKQYRKADK